MKQWATLILILFYFFLPVKGQFFFHSDSNRLWVMVFLSGGGIEFQPDHRVRPAESMEELQIVSSSLEKKENIFKPFFCCPKHNWY